MSTRAYLWTHWISERRQRSGGFPFHLWTQHLIYTHGLFFFFFVTMWLICYFSQLCFGISYQVFSVLVPVFKGTGVSWPATWGVIITAIERLAKPAILHVPPVQVRRNHGVFNPRPLTPFVNLPPFVRVLFRHRDRGVHQMCRGLLTGGLALRVDLQQRLLLVGADLRQRTGAALL